MTLASGRPMMLPPYDVIVPSPQLRPVFLPRHECDTATTKPNCFDPAGATTLVCPQWWRC